jgi:hypothetical protein
MTFDFAAYYRRPQDLKRLQIPASAIHWTERYEAPDRHYPMVLYLGCNILRTPDIAADVVAVFTALGLDFVAVAGVQFCCGITWDRNGAVPKGQAVAAATIDRLASFGPSLVVHWCPSCDVHFSDVVTGRDAADLPFGVTSAAALLADLAGTGRIPWRASVPRRTTLHGHTGRLGHHHGQRRAREDSSHIATILRAVPGIEHLGTIDAPPELDYDCGPSSAKFDRAEWRSLRSGLWADLTRAGADLVVTKSHACQREWCDLATPAVDVRCYISVVADGLGCDRDYRSNLVSTLKRSGEPETLVELTRANWSTHGWTEPEARAVLSSYDWSGRSGHLPPP